MQPVPDNSNDVKLPELLAPAGNMTCLHAAVSAGADAVYLGLDEFNARRNADNFTLDNLAEACDYAHLRGTLVFVTMNVEILPTELDRAVEVSCRAYQAGADAFIVQDIGLATALRQTLPHAELHISTQMNIHNAAGIVASAELGAKRVTLARELSLEEIAELSALAKSLGMEIECFAHGALCVCYSGQCLMSSMIGGRSANRGLCAQACRLPYELHRDDRDTALPSEGDRLLSPRDLCTIDLLEEMARAGVASLKIEGRMKSADYVHEVVSVYREALDALTSTRSVDNPANHGNWHARLAEAFSRGFTTAYLEKQRGNDIMSYGRPNNRGVFIGRVSDAENNVATIETEVALNAGDVVEFWTNKGHFTASVAAPVAEGGTTRIPVEQRVGCGDRVFRVRNAATVFSDDALQPKIPVRGQVVLRFGEPAYMRFESQNPARSLVHAGEAWGDVVEKARTKALDEGDVRAHVDRLGQAPFQLAELEIELGDGVGMGFSQIHHLRAEALDQLQQAILAPWHERASAHVSFESLRNGKNTNVKQRGGRGAAPTRNACEVMAWVTNPDCARAARRAGAASMYVPLLNFRRGQAQMNGMVLDAVTQAGYPKQCVMALPTIDHDPLPETREGKLSFDPWDYVRAGKPVFADSFASVLRALEEGASVEVGPHVPVTNRASLQHLASLGVSRIWLSPELALGQIAELAQNAPVELGVYVSGPQELMICEHCLLMSQGPCNEECGSCRRRYARHYLIDRKGFDFPVVTDLLGRSHLYNGIELDAATAIPDFIDMGISALMVDATLLDRKATEGAVGRIVRATNLALEEHRSIQKRPGTTTGHLFRGVQ